MTWQRRQKEDTMMDDPVRRAFETITIAILTADSADEKGYCRRLFNRAIGSLHILQAEIERLSQELEMKLPVVKDDAIRRGRQRNISRQSKRSKQC